MELMKATAARIEAKSFNVEFKQSCPGEWNELGLVS